MKEIEKSLLLTDLCSRLPYGVKVHVSGGDFDGHTMPLGYDLVAISNFGFEIWIKVYSPIYTPFGVPSIEQVKPYLRPLSSITEGEKNELKENNIKLDVYSNSKYIVYQWHGNVWEQDPLENEDILFLHHWFYKHFFDINGLIPKGLALEAQKGMYGYF